MIVVKNERTIRAALDAQLAADRRDFSPRGRPYLPWDWLRTIVGGHEFETRVDTLAVAIVDEEPQIVVLTHDGRVWQQRYLGGWLLSWGGTRRAYEPAISASGENRIIAWLDARKRCAA